MQLKSGYIFLRNVRFQGFHGVMPQERCVGGEFLVNLRVGYPLEVALYSDAVADTLDYAALYALVKRHVAQPSRLLEHLAGRIVTDICQTYPMTTTIDLELTKLNPPMGADCDGAGIEIHFANEEKD